MEYALFISHPEDLHFFTNQYSHLYYGNEFCQNLMPSQKDLAIILKFVKEHSISFSFVTPYVTDRGLHALIPLITQIAEILKTYEIIFNDWGVYSLVKQRFPHLELVLGRLLTKIKRDPRILFLKDRLSSQIWNYFQTTNLSIPWYRNFLINNGIDRVDLDNPLQGINLNFPDLHKSIYYPYSYVTTTRLCLTAGCDKPEAWYQIGIFPCQQECQQYTFYLRNDVMPVKLIRKGNTIFYKNEKILSNQYDRLVFQPKLPM
ncbi:MAG: hypothetical protein HWN66_02090 [Candidatus Helarchaeota archaeon]|nr:hypothetical protein [Candidatus Helarchaeota archaeon]